MRGALLLGLLLLATIASAQGNETPNLFLTERPDVIIVAKKPPKGGADLVSIAVQKSGYPADLLRKQIEALGELLKTRPTIASLAQRAPNSNLPQDTVLQANVGVLGLIDRENAVLGLEKIAKAFAGAPEPYTVDSLFIQYETEAPSTSTVQQWSDPEGSVLVQGQASPEYGIEYRIKLYTQDPAKIRIPEGPDAQAEKATPKKKVEEPRSDWWIWPVVIIAALALGALVYSLLLRPRPVARS